jgi:hypothetical protein
MEKEKVAIEDMPKARHGGSGSIYDWQCVKIEF